jgi:alkylation response protein AidB-like acyl-CoA dehydrogenase
MTNEGSVKTSKWTEVAREIGPVFADRAATHDLDESFVADNYAALREHRVFSAGIPTELGGGGASHPELCALLRELGRYCSSTALSLSMHTHLVAATVWRLRHGQPEEPLLRRIAEEQLVLISTGATDWLASNGTMKKVEGGFLFNGRKIFASGCPAGNLLVTSAPFEDPEAGPVVLHFAVPFSADGVSIKEDWHTLGMRGTGSNSVMLEDVFVPDGAISLRRPQGEWHPAWNVILTVALPLIMSVYVGLAEAAAEKARAAAKKKADSTPYVPRLVGQMENALATARMAVDSMIASAADYDFEPALDRANHALVCKTVAARAAIEAVDKAMEAVGGAGYYRDFGLERLFRDIRACAYHPLAEEKQLPFTGRFALGLDPVA